VRDPRAPSKLLGAIEVEGFGVVASSGDYERGFMHQGRRLHHVLDPQTGWPTQGVHGVALLARDVRAVNGWGTALMVQGMAAVPAWRATPVLPCWLQARWRTVAVERHGGCAEAGNCIKSIAVCA
jgi:thiamine biosynthesis lipoprotein